MQFKIFFSDCSEFVSDFECTNKDVSSYSLRDSSRSFPSGKLPISRDYLKVKLKFITEFLFNRSRFDLLICLAVPYLVPAVPNTEAPVAVYCPVSASSSNDLVLCLQYQPNHGQPPPLVRCSWRRIAGPGFRHLYVLCSVEQLL